MENYERYIGQVIDRRYKINKIIGIGGMAVVFEAHDMVLNHTVALKMLKDEIASDVQSVKRFVNESKAVAMLSHPNIVSIYDVSVKDNLKYIVMERVEGITLKSYMKKKGALGLKEVLSFSEQILKALDHAHSKGIIHRDIKPQNIMLLKNGRIKVTDFGIAKLPNAETVTMTDKAIGTVYYISPEQASGKPIDPRSDIYSLGVMMYEMATGELPFVADSPVSVALMQINDRPRKPTEIAPNIPVGLEQIILGAMEKDPDKRFQSAGMMLRYIMQLQSNPAYVFKTKKSSPKDASSKESTTSGGYAATEFADFRAPKRRSGAEKSMLPIISGVAAAFLLVLFVSAGVVLGKLLKNEQSNSPYSIEVPSLVGAIYDEALISQFDPSIYKIVEKYVYDANTPSNTIVGQEPEAGQKRKVLENKQYCEITLTISKGTQMVAVPDYVLLDYRSAEYNARALGLVPEIVRESSSHVGLGKVIRTSPAHGREVQIGSVITIYVSNDATITELQVPDFRNMTQSEAYAAMKGSDGEFDLKLGTLTYEYSSDIAEGRIISQSLEPMSTAVRGTKINFVISRGPENTDHGDE